MRRASERTRRRGGTVVEAAIVLTVFLTLVLGMIDLAMYLTRANIIAEAARQGTRQAIVHGSISPRPTQMAAWGPTTIGPVNANDSSAIVQAIKPYLYGLDPTTVFITASWPDGGNDPNSDNRVRVKVETTYRPMITFLFSGSLPISATSTMVIVH